MILSNLEIQRALDEGRLIIDPEPLPRVVTPNGPTCPYDSHSVDLRLSGEISVPQPGSFAFDPGGGGNLPDEIFRHTEKFLITPSQPFHLEPRKFVLAQTHEFVSLPTVKQPYLAARIEGKSSRARLGVLVHFTAPTVHPGFRGHLTLEMINLGPAPVILRPMMYIAQLIVEEVHGEVMRNPSQFDNQTRSEGLQ